jgi:hypothetical protein
LAPIELLSLLALAGALALGIELAAGERRRQRLVDTPELVTGPTVSIVLAARDEAAAVEEAVRSLLAQRYPVLEVLAVDDRSSDRTAEILGRLATADPRLRLLRLHELPAGWLGKNHALQRGAEQARGDLLLFTDADVAMAPDALGRAVAMLEAGPFDHLACGPHARVPGLVLQGVVAFFMLLFSLYARPWRASDPHSRAHVGIGAFNLVRTAAYRKVGGHRAIALRPDDDMRLGRLLKEAGYRQAFALAIELVRVDWYGSLGGLARGLEKNLFAGLGYRPSRVVGASAGLLLVFVAPLAALPASRGWALAANALAAAIVALLHAAAAHRQRACAAVGLLVPVFALLFLLVLWRAMALALWRGGIVWRGTFYPLGELRRGR